MSRIIMQFTLSACFISTFVGLYAQLKSTMTFVEKKGELLCWHKFILDSLGNFFEMGGCEGKDVVDMGFYQLQNDKINFIYKAPKDFPPVLRVEESPAENDSLVKITLLSCLGQPVPRGFEADAIEPNGRFFKACTLNEKGEVFINPNKYSSLRLTELDHYYGKWTSVDIKHLDQKIFLSFPEVFFYRYRRLDRINKLINCALV